MIVKEFRDFVLRGNVVDLAVAVVIAGAFGGVVNSLVSDILTPLLGIVGLPDFSTSVIHIGNGNPPAELRIGAFVNMVISFVFVAAAIFFFVVKPMERIMALRKQEEAAPPAGPTQLQLLTEIRDELRKRPA